MEQVHARAMLSAMLDPVVAIDAHGTILAANESCLRVFGYGPEELVGQNVTVLMGEPHRSLHDGYLARYRETGQTAILGRLREFPARRKDGREIEIELSVSRVEPAGDGAPFYCGSFRDVTERKAAERALAESERRFRAIVDGEYQFVGLLQPDGRTLEVNRAVLDASRSRRETLVGRRFWDMRCWPDPESSARVRQAVERAALGHFERFQIRFRGRVDQELLLDLSLKPMRDDEGRVALVIAEGRDITELQAAQRRELAMMQAFAQIGESASLLVHEIKNPITAINLALRAVAKQLGEDEGAVLADLVERMQKLEKLMRRTLSLTRPLELELAPCDPGALGRSLEQQMAPLAREANVTFELSVAPGCPAFHADGGRLEDVLVNLARNAIEAMAPRRSGRLRLSFEARAGGVRVLVDDDGPGIPEDVEARLFRPFVTTKANGTGLGLALARKTIEAHGGSIAAGRGPLGGARFELLLPG